MITFQTSGETGNSLKHLKNKLREHYGKDMVITSQPGKETTYTFLDAGNSILRSSYEDSGLSKESIIDMAAMIIEDEIRSADYEVSKYPRFSDLEHSDLIPSSLKRLFHGLIKTKAGVPKVSESVIFAVRPRSFISPLLLAISVYVNAMHESRELIDILSSMGFADNYREVQ